MEIKKIGDRKLVCFVILITIIFIICMSVFERWIYKEKYTNLQENEPYISLDIMDSYVKFTESYWNEDILGTHITEKYITSEKYEIETYDILIDDIITNKEIKKYSIKEEDYKLLLEYLINEKHFFSEVKEAYPNPGIVYELEVSNLNQTKSAILSIDEDDLIQGTNLLLTNILKSSSK